MSGRRCETTRLAKNMRRRGTGAPVRLVVPGTHAGAPSEARLARKAIWATLLSAAIFAVIAWVILADIVTRADMTSFNPLGV